VISFKEGKVLCRRKQLGKCDVHLKTSTTAYPPIKVHSLGHPEKSAGAAVTAGR